MLYFAPWKKVAILLAVIAGILFTAPNLMNQSTRDALPGWFPSDTVSLGLDLQGGAHVLVEAEMEPVFEQKMETLAVDLRTALKEAGVTRRGTPQVSTDAVTVKIPLPAETEIAREALEGLAQPLESAALTGVNSADLEVTYDEPSQVFRLTMTEGAKAETTERVILQSLEVVRRRIDPEGVREPTVARQGVDRILIQVPGADSAREILDLIDDPAVLGFHTVNMELGQDDIARGRTRPGFKALPELDNLERMMLVSRSPIITGDQVVGASAGFDQNSQPAVNFRFNAAAGKKFADFTRDNVGELFAIVVDDKIVSAPVIREIIPGGSGQITGNFTVEEATKLSVQISSGALPAKLTALESRTVGPELGADSIAAGKIACIIGFIAVMIFMVVVYGRFGIFADIALMANLAMIFGALSMLGATLTLPGIAGVVLTIGMAVDANVLIFERIREELEGGRKPARAIETGYERALSAIIDANITTLIAALILYALGSGPVRGFAVTLGIGIITSVFTAVMFTRLIAVQWFHAKRPKTLKITLLELIRNGTTIRFMRVRMIAAVASAALVAASLGLYAISGLNYGIDFRGGTLIEARTPGAADLGQIRGIVGAMDLGDVAVQSFGKPEDVLVRVEEIKGGEDARRTLVDKVEAALVAEIPGFEIRRVESVGPKVSGELVQAGIMAVLLAISAVLVYIWLRFEWQFSVGAVVALGHDVLLTIGIFSLLRLEFNLSIIAAILTIVGYSLNDTVVVYDRMRENLRKYKQKPLSDVIDLSLNETLSRTLMTSITTLLALGALYFLGGAVMQGFTFAMIWGVIVGTYSSIFVAAPILIWLGVKRDWSKQNAEQAGQGGVQFGSPDAP